VRIFDDMRPTPELSFAVREYHCAAGINITASHNTSEYNGYKVYGSNGAQLSPDDAAIVADNMARLDIFGSIKRMDYDAAVSRGLITSMGAETDERFLSLVASAVRFGELERNYSVRPKIVYTPFHGAGRVLVPEILARLGYDIFPVAAQMSPDGDFPTVVSPNPENPESFTLAIELAREVGADIIIGTDPDCDRVAVLALQDGEYRHISGNKTGALMLDYIINERRRCGDMPENPVAIKTIVTTELVRDIAAAQGVDCRDTFTGFKFMAELKDELESAGQGNVIFAFEESYGYMPGDFTRDKDAVTASALIADMTSHYLSRGMTLTGALDELQRKYGYSFERTVNLVMPGLDGLFEMRRLTQALRENPPRDIAGTAVVSRRDYLVGTETDANGIARPIALRGSNVLRYALADGTAVLVRPSGTEPKIKVYILARGASSDGERVLDKYERWARGLAES
jgi:phosphoglucomutase